MRDRTIGFIGTGIMGEPMAMHIVKAGYRVKVWNRSSDKLRALVAAGAEACSEASQAAEDVSALICMLSDGPTCDQMLFGERGVVPKMQRGSAVIVMSSIPVETAVRQSQRASEFGVHYMDAPVS